MSYLYHKGDATQILPILAIILDLEINKVHPHIVE